MARKSVEDQKQQNEAVTEPEGKPESGAEQEPEEDEEGLKILVALHPILYLSHQYRVGETLPANDPEMVEAWLEAGTAVWKPVSKEKPKARLVTAEPGIPGQAGYSEAGQENLAGKVPRTYGRRR